MQIITKKDIITNLNKQYGIKKGRRAKIMMACGVIVALLCLCTGYFLGAILAIVFFLCGLSDRIRSDHNRKKIEAGDFVVKKGICISKNIHGNASGIRRNIYFNNGDVYRVPQEDKILWEKAKRGDFFYLVYFRESGEIKKVYPGSVVVYEEVE
ncbi:MULTISPECIES: hypothetical protein [Anaerostipes]|uniref:hypothetical protein n=1 Tax=Anaerostipes TaxID=207244 RepID=UPI000952211D|nr:MULTISPECIES: hypothetical protein [unclassified Anaerostipes]MCI5623358.1 hypothetical protein [Anaerostipes sp.]MDY2727160.1 hypothetical protein [Anaerostipes faecalis]OLR58361.1 hypothetical protein BHF70_01210 [Anaerostipes sp. 494a]